jgi:hypothetical protein
MSPSLNSSSELEKQVIKQRSPPVAVYCGACLGNDPAFQHAAACQKFSFSFPRVTFSDADCNPSAPLALGRALVMEGRSLVYGGGSKGMMGTVSSAVLKHGGSVTAVTPTAILLAGGEGESLSVGGIELGDKGHERVSESPVLLPCIHGIMKLRSTNRHIDQGRASESNLFLTIKVALPTIWLCRLL